MEKYNGIYYIFKHNQKIGLRIYKEDSILKLIDGIAEKYKNEISFYDVWLTPEKQHHKNITIYLKHPITEEMIKDFEEIKLIKIKDFLTFKYEELELI